MSVPSITVLMTVYNAGRFLDASIESILGQTYRDFEFLIVDDASTDGSVTVAETWAGKDARIRVIRNAANKGQTPCLNQGLALARGKWIARQDADDLSDSERFEKQIAAVTKNPSLALLGTNGRIIDENDRQVGLLDAPLSHESIAWTAPFLNPFMHTSVLFRTDVIREELGGYDGSYRIAQDYDLWTRVLAKHPTENLKDRLVSYRHLNSSLSKAGRDVAFAEARKVSEREAARLLGHDLSFAENDLIAHFREGLPASERMKFWTLYHRLLGRLLSHPRDLRRTVALHHLKAAGAMTSRAPMIAELARAFSTQPFVVLGWLRERFSS